ncbi:hypothetical protein ABCS02_08285 [Microbacterium sp. X-17]|uniref:hypothetical protein n=1 Tax=Microbacterium sp. X-17 TaxID=3144404 RepID=UPI0031F5455A
MARSWWARAIVGAVCGLAWACALRAYMALLAGSESQFNWPGTFFGILLPGVLVGAALGSASSLSRDRRAILRWTAASPLLFAVFTLLLPGVFVALVTTGIGGGAIAVPLAGILGGYAFAGRRTWLRVVGAVVAVGVLAGLVWTVPFIAGLPLATPHGAWAALLIASLLVVEMLAASIPFARLRALSSAETPVATR